MRGFLLMFSLHLHDDHPKGDKWFGADKAKHFFTAAFVQSASYGGLRFLGANRSGSLAGASALTAGLSVGKEIHDGRSGGTRSWKDLTWDAAGIIAASALLHGAEP
jgi:putative lipoprotein